MKPFSCSLCNKKFEQETSLAEHGPKCKNKLMDCNVISWNIGRGLMSNKKQIEEVLVGEDIGICFLIETDEEQKKLISVPCFPKKISQTTQFTQQKWSTLQTK